MKLLDVVISQVMKSIYSTVLLLLILNASFGQESRIFEVTEDSIGSDDMARINAPEARKTAFFEDDQYVVSRTCSGEWGGTVKFQNKFSGIVYACSATCPVSVHRVDGKYIVTSTLAHMRGSTEVVEIKNPDSLDVYTIPPPREKIGRKEIRYVGDTESKSYRGVRVLVDSVGLHALGSFVYQGKYYCVVSGFRGTYIGKIEGKKIQEVQLVGKEQYWSTPGAGIFEMDDGRLIIPFRGGYIEILENKVNVLR